MQGYWWRKLRGNNKTEKTVNLLIAMFIAYCVGSAIGLMLACIVM